MQRKPDIRRVALQRLAEKSGGRNADHGEGMAFHHECRTHHRRIGPIRCLPNPVTQYDDRRSGGSVILWSEHPAAEGPHSKRGEITAADIFRAQRPGSRLDPLTPHAHSPATRLESRNLFKFWRFCLQALVQRKRNSLRLSSRARPPSRQANGASVSVRLPRRAADRLWRFSPGMTSETCQPSTSSGDRARSSGGSSAPLPTRTGGTPPTSCRRRRTCWRWRTIWRRWDDRGN